MIGPHRGRDLRRFLALTFVCGFFLLAGFASAQQIDVGVGYNILWSPKSITASAGYIPPPEKGGMYPSFYAQYILPNNFGLNIEGAFRYKQGIYNLYQPYRPFLYDANVMYAPRVGKKMFGDFMAGIGAQTTLFYAEYGTCTVSGGGCAARVNATHPMFHMGAGLRYYFFRNFYVRPEGHWYYIHNNTNEFHSDNVFRAGASIGYTWGEH